jgi:hypothetical protein
LPASSTPRGPCSARENSPFVVSGTWPVDTSLPRRSENKREGEQARSIASSGSPTSLGKHSQSTERRARIHPPIPAFPLWGRGATGRKSQTATGIHASMSATRTVPQQPIAVSGVVAYPLAQRRWFLGQFRPRIKGKLSRPLARTANWIIVRGTARPVVAVANRIGHTRQITRTAMYAVDSSCGRTIHPAPIITYIASHPPEIHRPTLPGHMIIGWSQHSSVCPGPPAVRLFAPLTIHIRRTCPCVETFPDLEVRIAQGCDRPPEKDRPDTRPCATAEIYHV